MINFGCVIIKNFSSLKAKLHIILYAVSIQ